MKASKVLQKYQPNQEKVSRYNVLHRGNRPLQQCDKGSEKFTLQGGRIAEIPSLKSHWSILKNLPSELFSAFGRDESKEHDRLVNKQHGSCSRGSFIGTEQHLSSHWRQSEARH